MCVELRLFLLLLLQDLAAGFQTSSQGVEVLVFALGVGGDRDGDATDRTARAVDVGVGQTVSCAKIGSVTTSAIVVDGVGMFAGSLLLHGVDAAF